METKLTVEKILEIFNTHFEFDILKKSRERKYVYARSMFYYTVKRHIPQITLTYLGKLTKKNHATILYNLKEFHNIYNYDPDFKKSYLILEKIIDFEANSLKRIVEKSKQVYGIAKFIHPEIIKRNGKKSIYKVFIKRGSFTKSSDEFHRN